jgi:fructokinase
LGWETKLLTRVGDDEHGEMVLRLLAERGVDTALVEVDPQLPTGRVTVRLTGTEPTFTIHGPAAWDRITGPRTLPAHDVFAYGTLVGRSLHSLDTLRRLLEETTALCALDINLRPPNNVDEAARIGVARAEVLKMNLEEIAGMAASLHIDADPRAFFDLSPRLRWICITRGPEGAELHNRAGDRWAVAGARVEVVDTVGAGDAFFAGLIDGIAGGAGEQAALATAQSRAVAVVGQRGGLPPV